MGRKVLTIKNHTPEDIKALFDSNEKYKIGLRLFAVYQVALGRASRKLEEFYDTSFKQITNWVHRFDEEGIEGLKDKPGRGRKGLLSEEQRNEIKALLERESPTTHGYNTETWTGPILIDWIERKFGVTYKKAQIYNIIKQLGFSHQKAKAAYPEADQKAQDEFKDTLKKTP